MAYTEEELALRIKEKYPQYKDVDNSELVSKVLDKYPVYGENLAKDDGGVEPEPTFDLDADIPEEDVGVLRQIFRDGQRIMLEFNRGMVDLIELGTEGLAEKYGADVPMPGGMPSMAGPSFVQLVTAPEELAEQMRDPEYQRDKELPDVVRPKAKALGIIDEEPEDPTFLQKTARFAGGEALLNIPLLRGAQALRGAYNTLKSPQAMTAAERFIGGIAEEFEKAPALLFTSELLGTGGFVAAQELPGPQWLKNTFSILAAPAAGSVPYLMASPGLFRLPKNKQPSSVDDLLEKVANKEIFIDDFKPIKPKGPKSILETDTRNKGTQYHGTPQPINKLLTSDDMLSEMNIYGQGFYTTDATDIALGYSKKGQGKEPTVYSVQEVAPVKFMDIDEFKFKDLGIKLSDEYQEVIDDMSGNPTVRQVMDEIRKMIDEPAFEIQEGAFFPINDQIQKLGYGGITHTGGRIFKKKPHSVKVYFEPEKQISLNKIDEQPTMPGVLEDPFKFEATREALALQIIQKRAAEAMLESALDPSAGVRAFDEKAVEKILGVVAPSRVLGDEGVQIIKEARGITRSGAALGDKISRFISKRIKDDPEVEQKVNDFINGKGMDDSLKPIASDLLAFDKKRLELQNIYLKVLDDELLAGLPAAERQRLQQVIRTSAQESDYSTRTYRAFLDEEYFEGLEKSGQYENLKKMAQFELTQNELRKNKYRGLSADEAQAKAARVAEEKIASYERQAGTGVNTLKARDEIGENLRRFLGEVTKPAARIGTTLEAMAKTIAPRYSNIELFKYLAKSGLAKDRAMGDYNVAFSIGKKGKGADEIGEMEGPVIYITQEMDDALNLLRYGRTKGEESKVFEALNTWHVLTKATKVLGNVESYPVALEGALMSSLANGVIPYPGGNMLRGARQAFAEYGGLDSVLSGKSPEARKAWLQDVDDMNKYGLATGSISSEMAQEGLRKSFKLLRGEAVEKTLDFFSKAYSAPDRMLRYVNWKVTQDSFRKTFPTASEEQIKKAAAQYVNDVFPNYDNLGLMVRYLERIGLAQPFIAFRAELIRNTTNQARYGAQMVSGRFGEQFGLNPNEANKLRMRASGTKRLAALGALSSGGVGTLKVLNQDNGLDEESYRGFQQSFARDYNNNSSLYVHVNEDGRSGWYADASYLVPQVEIGRYVDAIREGDDARLVDMFVEDFVGRGTLSQQFLARYFVGTDERGNPVYTSPDIADNAEVFLREFFETMKPGTINTIKRFIEAKGDPKKLDAAQLRLLGIRTVPWDEGNLISRMYSTKELANANASDYGARRNAFNRGDITQDELNQAYETQNSIYQKNMAILAQHYENASMEPWNYTIEERREQMKQAGLNARERLAIMMGEIPSLPKDRPLGMREKYDALGGTVQERRKSIGEIAKEDKIEAMKLLRYANQREFQDKQGMGPIELDIKALEPQDKIAFIRSQNPTPQSLKRMRVLGIINDEQLVILGKNSY